MKEKELKDFILERNNHKITAYADNIFPDALITDELNKKPCRVVKKSKLDSVTRRNFEDKKYFQEILQSSVEYFDLERTNRPIQTDTTQIEPLKLVSIQFADLIKEVENWQNFLPLNYAEQQICTTEELTNTMNDVLKKQEKIHRQNIDRIRRAYRTKLNDSVARIVYEAKKEKESVEVYLREQQKLINEEKESNLLELRNKINNCKNELSKLKTQTVKYQILLRKNGIFDTEAYTMNDEKIRAEDLIEYFQQTISLKEDRLKEVKDNIDIMEKVVDAVENGVSAINLPNYIANISNNNFYYADSLMDLNNFNRHSIFNKVEENSDYAAVEQGNGSGNSSNKWKKALLSHRQSILQYNTRKQSEIIGKTTPVFNQHPNSGLQVHRSASALNGSTTEFSDMIITVEGEQFSIYEEASIVKKKLYQKLVEVKKGYSKKKENLIAEIEELNLNLKKKFEQKELKCKHYKSELFKEKIKKHWEIGKNTTNGVLLKDVNDIEKRMKVTNHDKVSFSDFNGPAGVEDLTKLVEQKKNLTILSNTLI
ncbi:hypothetical protein HK099_004653 [Clydaea vesicula]|uniref:DUF4709 domain-containing protein n=1 Tax=Clydaea vesicula TaxID=447962 RepID=A0AAD5U000_9FUNG|nr:hypothetical protein HK099_004653 [Clydaea vesicula]